MFVGASPTAAPSSVRTGFLRRDRGGGGRDRPEALAIRGRHHWRAGARGSASVARLFACGAGDGNRTRILSLGIRYEPAIRAPGADVT